MELGEGQVGLGEVELGEGQVELGEGQVELGEGLVELGERGCTGRGAQRVIKDCSCAGV